MIYAAIVVYNKKCTDSVTIQCLQKWTNLKTLHVVVFDNSTSDFGNEEFCTKNEYSYLTYHENKGLSFAYNRIIESLNADSNDYLLILDDDTELTEAYLAEILYCEKSEINLPIVRSKIDGHIFSPSVMKSTVRSIAIESAAELEGKRITAINSGMVIKASVFNTIKYNEKLFLDYVDHDFMEQANDNDFRIKILNTPIVQNISRQNITNSSSARHRLEIYGKDYKRYCFKHRKRMYYYASFLKTTIIYCMQARTVSFIPIFIRCIYKSN